MKTKRGRPSTELTARDHSQKQERKLQKDISNGEKKIIKTILQKEDEIKKFSDLAKLFKVKSDADLIRKLINEIDKIQNLLSQEFRKDNRFLPSLKIKKILERHKRELSESEKEKSQILYSVPDDSLTDIKELSLPKSKENKSSIMKAENIIYAYRISLSSSSKRKNTEIKIKNILTQFFLIDKYLYEFRYDYKNRAPDKTIENFKNSTHKTNVERKNIGVVYEEVKRYLSEVTFIDDIVEEHHNYHQVDKFDTDELLDFVFENIESIKGDCIQRTTFERRWHEKIDNLFKEVNPKELI